MKRAILYARVSTDDQKDKGYSLPSQLEAMRNYAAKQRFEIVAEFQDDYSGATPIEMRPEGRKAHAMLQEGQADAIIAYTIDRFVRPPEDGDEWEMPILIRGRSSKIGDNSPESKTRAATQGV
jgi:site-specific DNA recombinase